MKKILFLTFLVLSATSGNYLYAQNDYYRKDNIYLDGNSPKDSIRKKSTPTTDIENPSVKGLPFKERLRLGGNLGLSFGTYTNINVSPMAGYEITRKLVVGAGPIFMYFRTQSPFVISSGRSTAYYGGRTFLMYSVHPNITLNAEYEALSVKYYDRSSSIVRFPRKWIGSPMLGASFSQPINGKYIKGFHITGLYNFNYYNQLNPTPQNVIHRQDRDNLSPYGSPFVIRVSFL